MNYKIVIINIFALTVLVNANGQSNVENVLASIEKNNKSLSASRQFWEAKKLEYKTGLTLPNPIIQGQFLFGSPEAAGNQTDFFVVQPFDFPTTYKKRRELAAAQSSISTSELAVGRQDILQEAKLVCLEMVYRNKLKIHYERRKLELDKLQSDFQTKLNKGDGNILDVNKTKLQLLEINQLNIENNVEIQKLQMQLIQLNGGKVVLFQDTVYPMQPELTSFEQVEMEYETADPIRKSLEQEQRIAEKKLDLTKTWRLPKFELGYRFQGILGQRYNGIHAGLTLPIWEQKYRKREQQANVLFTNLKLQSHLNEHFFEIKELFDRQDALKKSFNEYSFVISSINNTTLLDKVLRLGEITVIEYFLEMSFYQNALLHLLKLEKEYHVTLAEIMKYRL